VAWYGPIVMNSQEELRHAFAQLKDGSFLRPDAASGNSTRQPAAFS
jgi:hypothetical protein